MKSALPFRKLIRLEFSVSGLKSSEDAAALQYGLLLNDAIIRCHVDFSGGKCELLYNPSDTNSRKIIASVKRPLRAKAPDEAEINYAEIVKSGFHSQGAKNG
ncbi:MAG: hypothetical protein HYW05_03595 [Candidatus Diapherotrites archaeon]|nr:hypothetical protein [Candidatus Diapherotrites archaeon]